MQSRRERKPNRLKDFDYSSEGFYFVTLCTKDRRDHFGMCENGKMSLSGIGKIAKEYWQEIPGHYSNASIDEFIVMPDHIHGIILISGNEGSPGSKRSESRNPLSSAGLISRIVKSFKEAVTKAVAREMPRAGFGWQRSFYDHIIRSQESLTCLRSYIRDNPARWTLEKADPDHDFPFLK